MVLRKAYATVNKIGGTWLNLNQGIYNGPVKEDRNLEQARVLLEEVVADWPEELPDTPAITAARSYLRRTYRPAPTG